WLLFLALKLSKISTMKLVFPGIVLLSLTHALELSSAAELRGRRQPGAVPRAGRDAALQTAPL
ncbi:hypothetical protein NDU88_002550, partial [Pleurodeles waltl]